MPKVDINWDRVDTLAVEIKKHFWDMRHEGGEWATFNPTTNKDIWESLHTNEALVNAIIEIIVNLTVTEIATNMQNLLSGKPQQ